MDQRQELVNSDRILTGITLLVRQLQLLAQRVSLARVEDARVDQGVDRPAKSGSGRGG